MPENRELKLVTFGLGGHTQHYIGSTISGYENPETILKPYHWWAHPEGQISYHIKPGEGEGVPVINKREAVRTRIGFNLALSGPMVNVSLKDGDIDRCPEPSSELAFAVKGNQFGTLLKLQKESKSTVRPLDSVSVSEYVRMWHEVGAQTGVIRGDTIVWDD